MYFSFQALLSNGQSQALDTNNLFEARRRARTLSAQKLFVRNPSTGIMSELPL